MREILGWILILVVLGVLPPLFVMGCRALADALPEQEQ